MAHQPTERGTTAGGGHSNSTISGTAGVPPPPAPVASSSPGLVGASSVVERRRSRQNKSGRNARSISPPPGAHSSCASSVATHEDIIQDNQRLPLLLRHNSDDEDYDEGGIDSSKGHHHRRRPSIILRVITMVCPKGLFGMAGGKSPTGFCGRGDSIRWAVLMILCLQNSLFTVLRRYSQGVLMENYSKYECLLLGEIIKMAFSAYMIQETLGTGGGGSGSGSGTTKSGSGNVDGSNNSVDKSGSSNDGTEFKLQKRLWYLVSTSKKMMILALIYGAMNILSFVSLRNIGAGIFTIFAQAKIFTTALFSTIILNRKYSWTKWRALISLVLGVLLFSEPIWGNSANLYSANPDAKPMVGTAAVLIEVSLSGFASIYFEKAIKTDPLQLNIWERNFQLAMGSVPVYLMFIFADGGGSAGFGGGWSFLALLVSVLGAAGGLLVALSIKYGDSILKTLATTGAIVLSSFLDYWFLKGPLTPTMLIAGGQVVISICNYTFDMSPPEETNLGGGNSAVASPPKTLDNTTTVREDGGAGVAGIAELTRTISRDSGDEESPLVTRIRRNASEDHE